MNNKDKPKIFYNYTKVTNKVQRHRSSKEYDFLAYIRVVFKWAVEFSGLTRPKLELLLYLYPRGVFTKYHFLEVHKIIGIYQNKTFQEFIKEGWITVWREKKRNESALYTLTNKSNIICSKMHKFCTGDLAIPVDKRYNPINRDNKKIDGYYMKLITQMNKEREDRTKVDE